MKATAVPPKHRPPWKSIAERGLPFLLSEGCPSIRYRTRKEILGEPVTGRGMTELQNRILEDPAVRQMIASQAGDGWIGRSFHGDAGMEHGIRLLCEKGLEPRHPVLRRAVAALERAGDRLALGITKTGPLVDDLGLGGPRLIQAAVFAYAGVEDRPFLREQIRGAADRVSNVAAVESIGAISEKYRGKLVFRPGVRWPTIYDLRLLAFTSGWRDPARVRSVGTGIARLVELSPIPDIYVKCGSQLIAPASYAMHDFRRGLGGASAVEAGLWFHRMELLSRLGVIRRVPALAGQVQELADILDRGAGLFTIPLRHDVFRRWGSYTGLMLEPDWRSQMRRASDLTFRSVLILNSALR